MKDDRAGRGADSSGGEGALQQVLGHASIETTQRYARLSDEAVARAAGRLHARDSSRGFWHRTADYFPLGSLLPVGCESRERSAEGTPSSGLTVRPWSKYFSGSCDPWRSASESSQWAEAK